MRVLGSSQDEFGIQEERSPVNAKHLTNLSLRQRLEPASQSGGVDLLSRSKSVLLAGAGLIGLVGLAAPAFAETVDVDYVGLPYYDTVNLNGTIDTNSYTDDDQLAGQILLTVTYPPSKQQYTLPVWCDDIFHNIYLGGNSYTYTTGSFSTDNDSTNASPLTGKQISWIEDLAAYGNAQITAG